MVKSRLQAGQAHAQRYKSALDGVLTILKEEGVEGLYKGVGSKLTQSVLTAAILFAGQKRIYEMTKKVRFRFPSSLCCMMLNRSVGIYSRACQVTCTCISYSSNIAVKRFESMKDVPVLGINRILIT